ncbi:MAG: hypothetical protein ACFWUL_01230 [Dialister sp.]
MICAAIFAATPLTSSRLKAKGSRPRRFARTAYHGKTKNTNKTRCP